MATPDAAALPEDSTDGDYAAQQHAEYYAADEDYGAQQQSSEGAIPDYNARLGYGTDQGRWLMEQVSTKEEGTAKRRGRPARVFHEVGEGTAAPTAAGAVMDRGDEAGEAKVHDAPGINVGVITGLVCAIVLTCLFVLWFVLWMFRPLAQRE